MTKINAVIHMKETAAKIANDKITFLTNQQDADLKIKENYSLVIDKLSSLKGGCPTKQEVEAACAFAKANGVNCDDLMGKVQYGADNRAWMLTPTEGLDKKNLDAFGDVIKRLQMDMDRVGDKITQKNTQIQRYVTEANDAEAGGASYLSDYKSLLQELRK